MTHIELFITLNNVDTAYKCDIKNKKGKWDCIVYQEHFIYKKFKADTLFKCFEKLAAYLDTLGEVVVINGKNINELYVSILRSHLLIVRTDKLLNRQNIG